MTYKLEVYASGVGTILSETSEVPIIMPNIGDTISVPGHEYCFFAYNRIIE